MRNSAIFALSGLFVVACGPTDTPADSSGTDGGTDSASDSDSASASTTGASDTDSGGTGGSSSSTAGTSGGTTTGGSTGGDGGYEAPIDWVPCPLYTGSNGPDEAECAEILLPADWDDLEGLKLTYFLKRIGNAQGSKQLWMLMGGPGGAGAGYEGFADVYTDVDPELVVYLPDHRGVGRSTRLGCPDQEAAASPEGTRITEEEWPACVSAMQDVWGEYLDDVNTTQAARDVVWLFDQLRGDQEIHLFGSSYGTYWAHRVLQVDPAGPDAVTLLGVAQPGFNFGPWTKNYNEAGERFVAECDGNALCSSKMGPDALAKAYSILEAVKNGQCAAAGLDADTLKAYFGAQLSFSRTGRNVILPVLYRLDRCSAQDVVALQSAAPKMADPLAGLLDDPLWSSAVNAHIALSEMYKEPLLEAAEIQGFHDDALFSLRSNAALRDRYEWWPRYANDSFVDAFAETDIPVLILNGQFDPNTPTSGAEVLAAQLGGPGQYYFEVPGGTHGWDSPTTEGYGCAENMFFSFMQDPDGPILDCLGIIEPLNWAGEPGQAQSFFGTADMWEN